MPDKELDEGKRRLLVAATGVAGGIATAATAVPFVASMLPSERAKAAGAPVEADIGSLAPGREDHGRVARQAGVDRAPHEGDARGDQGRATTRWPIRRARASRAS